MLVEREKERYSDNIIYCPSQVHLDLTGNCLMHHDVLAPVSGLTQLVYLDLTNNPLYSAPRHRDTLNPTLDRRQLSRAKVVQVGSSRLIISPQVSPPAPSRRRSRRSCSPCLSPGRRTSSQSPVRAVWSQSPPSVRGRGGGDGRCERR